MENVALYTKLATLPENLKSEVSDFIDFLLSKAIKDKKQASISKPKFGSAKGMFKVSADFDEPLEDFKRLYELMNNLINTHALIWYLNGDNDYLARLKKP